MKMRGHLQNLQQDWQTKRIIATFELTEVNPGDLAKLREEDLDIEAKKHSERRTNKANRMLWKCLEISAEAIGSDKWTLYLSALRHYGQFELVEMDPKALEKFRQIYRECEDIGYSIKDGKEMRQVLCYFGSHTYNSKEFSRLLDGVINDMKAAGLETPTSEEMQRAIKELEERENGENSITAL